jgi:predicted RNase H-like nuclease (RuvC/YqgF family)
MEGTMLTGQAVEMIVAAALKIIEGISDKVKKAELEKYIRQLEAGILQTLDAAGAMTDHIRKLKKQLSEKEELIETLKKELKKREGTE